PDVIGRRPERMARHLLGRRRERKAGLQRLRQLREMAVFLLLKGGDLLAEGVDLCPQPIPFVPRDQGCEYLSRGCLQRGRGEHRDDHWRFSERLLLRIIPPPWGRTTRLTSPPSPPACRPPRSPAPSGPRTPRWSGRPSRSPSSGTCPGCGPRPAP